MAKFNQAGTRPATASPIKAEAVASGVTFEGGPGFVRDTKSELFLLAVSNFVGEDTFYEQAGRRDDRYSALVRQVAVADVEWLTRFVRWLRTEANMRSASLVAAGEGVKARLEAGLGGGNRQLVAAALDRADEPGEFLAYWTSKYGRAVPKPVKRGLADAVVRLYGEYSLLKYDTASKGFRFGDVIDLVHPTPAAAKPWQGRLFAHALDRRHGRDDMSLDGLPMVAANADLRARAAEDPDALLDPDALKAAGMTWEDVLSLAGSRVDKAKLWAALVPSLPYMAALRNLRNLDEAGVPDDVAEQLAARLADPGQVAKSRILPMRFLSAYRAAPSLRWGHALDKALTASLGNVPELPGRTLILVDTSGSMDSAFSKDGTLMRWDAAVVFGLALGQRCAATDVVSFSSGGWGGRGAASLVFPQVRGESLLRSIERWKSGGYFIGGGTDTEGAVRRHYAGHDRVVILTDEQAAYHGHGDVTAAVPADRMVYTWNLAGYQRGHAPSGSGTRHTFGGLTDQAFAMIPLLEAGRSCDWPF